MNKRTILLAVLALVVIGGASWFLYFQDEAPPPKPMAVPAKPAATAAKADAPKPPAPQAAAAPTPASPTPAAPPPSDPAAMDAAIKSSQARQKDLEKTVADLQQQIQMKDRQIAEMEKKAGAKK
jgi:peptidoglycan hydrolase CwlO-like protein